MTLKTDSITERILQAYSRLQSWPAVGREFGVTPGTAYRIAHGHDPKSPAIRAALGLPALAPAPVCAACGVVHLGACPQEHKLRGKYHLWRDEAPAWWAYLTGWLSGGWEWT